MIMRVLHDVFYHCEGGGNKNGMVWILWYWRETSQKQRIQAYTQAARKTRLLDRYSGMFLGHCKVFIIGESADEEKKIAGRTIF